MPSGTPGIRRRLQRRTKPRVEDARGRHGQRRAGDAGRGRRGLRSGPGSPSSQAPPAAPLGTVPPRTCHAPYLSGFVELLLQPGHRHGAGETARGRGRVRCRKGGGGGAGQEAEPDAAVAGPPLVVPPLGLWARGRGAEPTRARAERHPDVRGG